MIRAGVSAIIILAVASGSSAIADDAKINNVDYESLLMRTDEAEVCYRSLSESFPDAEEKGQEAQAVLWLGCKCWQDSSRYILEQSSVTDPILLNALIQVTSNFEVIEKTLGGDFAAFAVFLNEEGPERLGFDNSDFSEAMAKTRTFLDSIGSDLPTHLMNNVEACDDLQIYVDKVRLDYPDWGPVRERSFPIPID
ncbi:MAG: hypothetical protein AAFX02_08160 [Pseudomonadota bacterium]